MKPDPYAAWRSRDYRLYSTSWFLLTFSKQVETVAVGINIYDRTGDPLALGWVGLVQALPIMLLAIAGGQIADRFNRRRVLLCTLAATAVSSSGLWATAFFQGPVWWMYLFLGLAATSIALGGPSRTSMLPQLVSTEIFPNAITWSTTVFHISAMTGPAIGGLIMGLEGTAVAAFSLVVLLRIFSFAAMVFLHDRPHTTHTKTISLQSLLAGIRFVWRTKLILATITLDLFAVLLGGFTYLLPVFVKDILNVDKSWVGFLHQPKPSAPSL